MSHITTSFVVLGAAVALFILNRFPPEIVALGAALALYAGGILESGHLFVFTAVFGQLISNTATALIMIPIAISAASELGVPPRPVLMSAAVAAPVEPAITAALFLAEFVDDVPRAHIDIAGTAWANSSQPWRPKGATGFGARLLIETARNFVAPVSGRAPS